MTTFIPAAIVDRLGWMLVHSAWQLALLAVLAWLTVRLMSRRSAQLRYCLLLAALSGCVAAPVATWFWLANQLPQVSMSTQDRDDLLGAFPVDLSPGGLAPQTELDGTQMDAAEATARRRGSHQNERLAPAGLQPDQEARIATLSSVGRTIRPWLPSIVLLWLAGVLIASLRPLLSWRTVRRLRTVGVSAAPDSVQSVLARTAQRLRLRQTVRILQSSLVKVPIVVGYLRPVILLPLSVVSGLPVSQLEAILAHELAHIRRHDYLVNLLQTLVETLFFYHPGVWWLSHRLRAERENCCDDVAVALLGDRVQYGRSLLALEELRGAATSLALGVHGGSLPARIRRILDREPAPPSLAAGSLAAMVMLSVAALSAGVWPGAFAPPDVPVDPRTAELAIASHPPDDIWPQWGGSPSRNNASAASNLPAAWNLEAGSNVKWAVPLGTFSFGSPVVASGKVLIGTNNGAGRIARYPSSKDLSCLKCFDERTGEFLWQYSSEKLPTGRIHDWPEIGICSTPCILGDRVWLTTNRCEVVCLDLHGFRDDQNDGPVVDEPHVSPQEADVIWRFDMLKNLGVSPSYQSCSSVTVVGELVLLNTANGVDESQQHVVAPGAPSFLALNRHTGHVVWQDASPGGNILGRECPSSSPAVGRIGGVVQAVFGGGDGWLYAFDFGQMQQGKTRLLWKFDGNPKTAKYFLGAKGTRNSIIATPVIYHDKVYLPMGQNPENGEGQGRLWCIDATKRGDLSPELVFNQAHPDVPIPHKRLQACETDQGDFTRPNPNAGAVWQYESFDRNGNGKLEFEESMHRSCGSVAIADDLMYVADLSGLIHCLDARTGALHWTHDSQASIWATPLIADGKVYLGNEDGDVFVFRLAARKELLATNTSDASIYATVAAANRTLYIGTKTRLMAITTPAAAPQGEPAGNQPPAKPDANETIGRIVGTLIDERTGKPIAGALIACSPVRNESGGGGANATTDVGGNFRLSGLSPGIYNVWLKLYDLDPRMTVAADQGIVVEAGKEAVSRLRMMTGQKVAGKVVDEAGIALAGKNVACYSAARPESSSAVQSIKTGGDGSFAFYLPPGKAWIYVMHNALQGENLTDQVVIDVPATEAPPLLTLRLHPSESRFGSNQWLPRSTKGTQIVRREGNQNVSGVVVDPDGKSIAPARVFKYDGPFIETDQNGKFLVPTDKGTQFIMLAYAAGYRVWFGTPTSGDVLKIVMEPKDTPNKANAPPPGQANETKERDERPAAARKFEPFECETVDALTGQPITNVTVQFLFKKPATADLPEEIVKNVIYTNVKTSRFSFVVPDDVLDRPELLIQWGAGHPDYELHSPQERVPLAAILRDEPKSARNTFRRIKLQPKQKSVADDRVSLADLVRDFNAENKKLQRGLDQPPLTEDEVVAAIRRSKWKPGERNRSEREFAAFKSVAQTRQIPQESYFAVWTSEKSSTFVVNHLWSIQLYLPSLDGDGFDGYSIRHTKLHEETIDPQSVAWGQPDVDGLSLGAYLSPKKDKYQIGERVHLRLFVRNEGIKAVPVTWPNTSHPMPVVTDHLGAKVAVRIGNDDWTLDWISGFIGGGALSPGDAHAFTVPFEIGIGGDGKNKLIGRFIDAHPGQTLQLKVREPNGNNRTRADDEPEPESGNVSFTVAEAGK